MIESQGKMHCPKCGNILSVVPTAYGWRAICEEDEIRWTWVRGRFGETNGTPHAEHYSPMHDNARSRDETAT